MSTGSITTSGLGSGIDIEALIDQMSEIEKRPITILEAKKTIYQGQISAYQIFNQYASSFNSALSSLLLPSIYNAMTSTLSDPSVASLVTNSTADEGRYKLKVDNIAEAQKVVTANSDTDPNQALGEGKLKINIGKHDSVANTFTVDSTVEIDINSSNNTLTGIRDAINAADAGLTATIINDGIGDRLILTSKETGISSAFEIEVDAVVGDPLHDFAFDPLNPAGNSAMTSLQEATNATFSIDGIAMTNETNLIDSAIKGLTLTLEKEGETTITVSKTTSAIESSITSFVEAYNELNNVYREAIAYDAETDSAGALNGESSVRNFMEQIKRLVTGTVDNVAGGATSLTQIGISMQEDGSLAIDSEKLEAALANPKLNVEALFRTTGTPSTKGVSFVSATAATKPGQYTYNLQRDSSGNITGTINGVAVTVDGNNVSGAGITLLFEEGQTNLKGALTYSEGIINKLQTSVDAALDTTTGSLGKRINSLNDMVDDINNRISTLNERVAVRMNRLRNQLNTMDTYLAEMNSLSLFLEQQLASISTSNSKS